MQPLNKHFMSLFSGVVTRIAPFDFRTKLRSLYIFNSSMVDLLLNESSLQYNMQHHLTL